MVNRKKNREARRRRAAYPEIGVGEAVLVDREECGRNVPLKLAEGSSLKMLYGQFVFRRAYGHRKPGAYRPHVGAREARRKGAA